jgi:hypothetical protein
MLFAKLLFAPLGSANGQYIALETRPHILSPRRNIDPNGVLPLAEALHVESIPKLQGRLTEVVTKAKWQRLSDRLPFIAEGAAGYDPVPAKLVPTVTV